MEMSVARRIAERFSSLPPEHRRAVYEKMRSQGVTLAQLPILPRSPGTGETVSYAQLRQWFLWQLDPASTAYHIAGALRLSGSLDVSALRAGFDALVARHEALRTVFHPGEHGLAEQAILPALPLDIAQIDLRGVAPDEREARAMQAAQQLNATPFDLTQGPLLRVALLQLTDAEHILVVVMHHIVSDGWSMQLIVDEFVARYRARVQGREPDWAPLAIQYADYAVWQRQWLEAGEKERQLAYWRQQLGAEHPVLQLPTDHPRSAQADYRAARHAFDLPAALAAQLQQRVKAEGMTLFMLLLAGFQALLQRYTGQGDIRVGVPIANRNRVETEGVVGFFVNTQVLRNRIDSRMTLGTILDQAREAALGAQAHQDLPFEQLVEALQPERSLAHSPLFQVMVNHQREDYRALARLPGLQLTPYDLGEQAAQFELTLDTAEHPDGRVSATLTYAAELFERDTIVRLGEHYLTLLEQFATHSERMLGEVDLLSDAERARLAAWGGNAQRYPDAEPVHRLIERQAERSPQASALVLDDAELSYAELNRQANRLAHRLIALGVGPETRVGIAVERSIGMVVGLLAILKAGGAYVPLDPDYPAERLAYMVGDSGISLLLTQRHLRERMPQPAGLAVLESDTLDVSAEPDCNPEVALHPHHLAYMIYTSGSTGRPKGVMVRHEALSHFLSSMRDKPGMTAEDTLVAVTSLSFDIAALELYLPLIVGARIVLASRTVTRDGLALSALLRDSGATVLQSTPSGWRMLLAAGWTNDSGRHFKGLCGGEALQPDLAHTLTGIGVELWNMYGPTETTIWSAAGRVGTAAPSLGEPIAATQLYVLDAGLNLVPHGVAGELYLGGVGLARGYFKRPELTAERFVADPFDTHGGRLYRTGDLVRWRTDGRIEYLGRIDHQVKIRGFRIELGEIETQLLAQPNVREAVVVAQEGPGPGGMRLAAYVTPNNAAQLDAGELKAALGRSLPDYMVPGMLLVLEALPLTPNGKVDRKALPAADGAQRQQVFEAPQGAAEQAMAAIWSEVLGVERVGRNDNFFELGGHSLLATSLVARVRHAWPGGQPVDLPLRAVFSSPTLAALALTVEESRTEHHAMADDVERPILRPATRTKAMPLSPMQRRLWLIAKLSDTAAAGGGAAYNMSTALSLSGELSVPAVQASINAIISRHEILRTAYPENDDGDPIAVIAPRLTLDVPLVDLSAAAREEHNTLVEQAMFEHANRPFDLARPPLMRVTLLKLETQRHVLLFSIHHIVADGWSLGVLVNEFVSLYRAWQDDRAPALPRLPVQYADYAAWQHQVWQSAALAREADFWRGYLHGAPTTPVLGTDFPRPAKPSQEGDVVRFSIPPAMRDGLLRLAREQDVTLFMLLLATVQLLLHRQTGSDDLLIGTDVAGRNHPDLEGLVGFFVNLLPLRSRTEAGARFVDLLARTRQNALDAFEHQDLPFDQLVELLDIPRDRRWNPLVQILFVLQNVPDKRFDISGLQVEALQETKVHSKFDMVLFAAEDRDGLHIDWVYSTALFRRETIEKFASAWMDLLRQVLAEPKSPLERFVIPKVREPKVTDHGKPMSNKLDKLKKIASQAPKAAIPQSPQSPIRTSFLRPGHTFPLVIEPASRDLDVIAWARTQRQFIESTLCRHGGILFRNFGLKTPQDFEAFAEVIEPELYGSYGDLPKKEGGRNIYRSTPYPERQMILYHNESSHLDRWPRKQWFFCEQPAPVGGATPIVDCREVVRRLPADLIDKFERKQLLYVRTFAGKLDVSWQDFFKTEWREEVEARLKAAGTAFRWLDHDELQTRTLCPAVISHPLTGERVFFNQLQLHHIYCLEPEARSDLLAMFGLERMPRHVYYGDGTPIEDEAMKLIGQVYEACAVRFDWQQGDVVMLDNMLAAHARDPYEGPRKIVVAMGAMFERAALTPLERTEPDTAAIQG